LSGRSAEPRTGSGPVWGLAAILVVTAGWWGLALAPLGDADWLVSARTVCFGSAPGGLPDTAGWISLIGEPALMTGLLLAGWGRQLRAALRARRAAAFGVARWAAVTVAGSVLLAAGPSGKAASGAAPASPPPGAVAPLDEPAPALRLVDQAGDTVSLADFRGRRVLVAFAFGHCETVCPVLVRRAVETRARLADAPELLVVTLDPWRDTPARLPHLASRWGLGPGEHLLSGDPDAVEATLDAWRIGRRRDPHTGDVVHGDVAYLVDGRGRLACALVGAAPIEAIAARCRA